MRAEDWDFGTPVLGSSTIRLHQPHDVVEGGRSVMLTSASCKVDTEEQKASTSAR